MRFIIDVPEGAIVLGKMEYNSDDPFDLLFAIDSLPETLEMRLHEALREAKATTFNEIITRFPERFKNIGYENPDQVPENITYTALGIKFADDGSGFEKAEISRDIVDDLNDCRFEADTSVSIDLTDQADDLRRLAHICLDKIMFQKRPDKNYIL